MELFDALHAFGQWSRESTKLEARNPKQIRMLQCPKHATRSALVIQISDFESVSDFELRALGFHRFATNFP
jgi:hypothetical protein